jgi:hypothetical protein
MAEQIEDLKDDIAEVKQKQKQVDRDFYSKLEHALKGLEGETSKRFNASKEQVEEDEIISLNKKEKYVKPQKKKHQYSDNMETATFKRFTVPLDVLTDIVKVILEMELKNEITAVNENKAFIEIKVEYQNGLGFHQKAIANIESILDDYNHYRFEEEETDWRNS